jgi:copper transport protein
VTRRACAGLAGVLFVLVAMVWAPAPAQSHALLVSSTPADGESVDTTPTQVLLTFTEVPDLKLTTVHVLGADGKQLETGAVATVAGQPTQVSVPVSALPKGVYTITWRTTSASDGHTTAGSLAFGVGVPAIAAGTNGTASAVQSPSPTVLGIAGRWLFYVGAVLMLGAAVVGAFVVADVRNVPGLAVLAAWLSAAAGLALTIADQRAKAETSLGTLLSSSTGHKLLTEVAAVALAGLAVGWAAFRPSRRALLAVGAGAAAVMLGRTLAGHADSSTVRWFTITVHWGHLVSVGAWVGGLLWLLVALRRGDPGQGRGLARRFSSVAGVTLAVVAVTGTLRAVNLVGAWDRLASTDFGVALLVKLGLFAALVALGAVSRFRHVPAAAAAEGLGRLRRVVRGEVAVAAGVLGATAVLAGLPPSAILAEASRPPPPATIIVTGNDYATSVRVRLAVTPGLPGPNRFDATVSDYDSGRPFAAETVSLRFQIKDFPDVAPATLDLTRTPNGQWGGFGRPISIDGSWTVTAMVQSGADAVEVPMQFVPRKPETTATPVAGSDTAGACGRGQPDDAVTVTWDSDPNPPKAEGATLQLTVRRDGRVVTGAKVCVAADMPDMQHPGINTVSKEVGAGRYDAALKFGMPGAWAASITIAEPGRPPALVPLKLDVK